MVAIPLVTLYFARQCTQSMKDSVYEILVCLSCCCSSVSKTGYVNYPFKICNITFADMAMKEG